MTFATDWSPESAVTARQRTGRNLAPDPTPDPRQAQPVRGRVLKPFCIKGQRVEVGEEVTLRRFEALDMQALGKLELI